MRLERWNQNKMFSVMTNANTGESTLILIPINFAPVIHRPRWGQRCWPFPSGPRWPVETPALSVWSARRHRTEPTRRSPKWGKMSGWGLGKKTKWHTHLKFCRDTHHYTLKDLCCNRGQHPLIVVLPDAGEDSWELAGNRPEQDTQCDVDVLQICGRGDRTSGKYEWRNTNNPFHPCQWFT